MQQAAFEGAKQNEILSTTTTLQIAALEMVDRPAGCRGKVKDNLDDS